MTRALLTSLLLTFSTVASAQFSVPYEDVHAGAVPPVTWTGASADRGGLITTAVPGYITAVKYFKAIGAGGPVTMNVWNASTCALILSQAVSNESASGWQTQPLKSYVFVAAGTVRVTYRATITRTLAAGPVNGLTKPLVRGSLSLQPVSGCSLVSDARDYYVDINFIPAFSGLYQ